MKTLLLIIFFTFSVLNSNENANAQTASDYDIYAVSLKVMQYADDGNLTKIGTAFGPHVACLSAGKIYGLLDPIRNVGKWSDKVNSQVIKLLSLSEKLSLACVHPSPYVSLGAQMSEFAKEASTLADMTRDAKKSESLQACEAKLQMAKDELTNLGSSKTFTGAQKSGITRIITAISEENNKTPTALKAK